MWEELIVIVGGTIISVLASWKLFGYFLGIMFAEDE